MRNLFLEKIKGERRILLLGFGREGRSSYRWLRENLPQIEVAVADKNENIVNEFKETGTPPQFFTGENYLSAIHQYQVILKSPGIYLPEDLGKRKTILTQTGLFLEKYREQIIGITGTKGKSTTASLVAGFLTCSGKKNILLGNIGVPAFDKLAEITRETTIVFELSAHQLRDVTRSPHKAVLLNIYPEHLDFFKSHEAYVRAKRNIFRFMKPDDMAIDGTEFNLYELSKEKLHKIAEKLFVTPPPIELLIEKSPLPGLHNIFNILVAMAVTADNDISPAKLTDCLGNFKPLPHRLEPVGTFSGISFYNDSISTIPQSTVAALKSLPDTDVLLLGGFDRGIDYRPLTNFLSKIHIPYIFFSGKAGDVMYELLKGSTIKSQLIKSDGIEESLRKIKTLKNIRSVLLSPAAASYDAYHNFEHRGDTFKKSVKQLYSA